MSAGLLAITRDQGVSEDAATIQKQLRELLENLLSDSVTLGKPYFEAHAALAEAFQEASVQNWDGYGGKPIHPFTYQHAQRFLDLLPRNFPMPEIAADPDGEIAFEWSHRPRRILSVSVGKDGELTYAGLFDKSKIHGVEYLTNELPREIVQKLARLFER